MKLLHNLCLMVVIACFSLGCALDTDSTDDSEQPSGVTVDYELMIELFPECATDIELCLGDPDILAELRAAGAVQGSDDGLSAAGSTWTIVSYRCQRPAPAYRKMERWCHAAGGSPSGPWSDRSCSSRRFRRHTMLCSKF